MITPELAWRMRVERGLGLNPNAQYSVPRLRQIAVLQEHHRLELARLDGEIHAMAQSQPGERQ